MGVPWQRAVALLTIALLAVLPAAGGMCAALCVPPVDQAQALEDDGVAGDCHGAGAPADLRLQGASGCERHEASHSAQVPSLTASRAEIAPSPGAFRPGGGLPDGHSHDSVPLSPHASLTAPVPPPGAPLVLRI